MKNILVPTDFSDHAMAAAHLACQIGRKSSAKVTLLSVVEMPHGSSFNTTGQTAESNAPGDNVYVVEMMKQNKEKMEELVNRDEFEGTDLHYNIVVGDPYRHISKVVEEQSMDLVVMGTKGATGLEEFLVGSNTEKVVRRSKAPVLTVKEEVDLDKIKAIVFASSLHDDDKVLATHLKKLQSALNAKLHLLRVNTPNNFQNDRTTHANMKAFAEENGLTDVEFHTYGDAIEEDGIIHFAEEHSIDLIAMATHGRTGFAHLLSGSIAEDVVNHAKRPVWTFNIK